MNEISDQKSKFVLVLSHRGGVGKTTLATGIASSLQSRYSTRILFVDFGPDGSGSYIMAGPDQALKPADPSEQNFLQLHVARDTDTRVVWAPGMGSSGKFWDLLERTANSQAMDYVLVDMPVSGVEDLQEALRKAWLVLVAVPCDGPGFRSIVPLLESLNEARSKPGRDFSVRAILTMTGVPNPERQALEQFQRRYLRPMLLRQDFPFDLEIRKRMAKGSVPLVATPDDLTPGLLALEEIAKEILSLANPEAFLTPVP
jgi:cellulose biosynthesis protein BcsQ